MGPGNLEDDLTEELMGSQAKEKSDYSLDNSATHKNEINGVGVGKPIIKSNYSEEFKINEKNCEVVVVTSRKWNSQEAGKDIALKLMEKLEHQPKFILLFSTIHYENNGGFQPILDEIYLHFPNNVNLIGGTISGFINSDGIFSRGITAMAVYKKNMQVTTAIGKHTKRTPTFAARECAKAIKKRIQTPDFIFSMIPAGTVPRLPFMKRRRIIPIPSIVNKTIMTIMSGIFNLAEYGVGREDEILESFSKEFQRTKVAVGNSYDNNNSFTNYQFNNRKIYTTSMIALALSNVSESDLIHTTKFSCSSPTFSIGDINMNGCSIGSINSKNSLDEILRILSWPKEYLNERIYRKTYYYPVGYIEKGLAHTHVMGLFIGNHIAFTHKLKKKEMCILTQSGKEYYEDIQKKIYQIKNKKNKIFLGVLCTSQLETLGSKNLKIKEILENKFFNNGFIVIFAGGEGSILNGNYNYLNCSAVLSTIGIND